MLRYLEQNLGILCLKQTLDGLKENFLDGLEIRLNMFEADIRWIESKTFKIFSFQNKPFKADIRWN